MAEGDSGGPARGRWSRTGSRKIAGDLGRQYTCFLLELSAPCQGYPGPQARTQAVSQDVTKQEVAPRKPHRLC